MGTVDSKNKQQITYSVAVHEFIFLESQMKLT